MLRADRKADVNQTCQQSVFSPIRTCIRIWCTVDAVEQRSQMFVYRPFRFSLSLVPSRPKACSQANVAGGIVLVCDSRFGGGAVIRKREWGRDVWNTVVFLFLAAYASCDGFAAKPHSTTTQYRQLRRVMPQFWFAQKNIWTLNGSCMHLPNCANCANLRLLWRFRRETSLDYYTIPPATQGNAPILVCAKKHLNTERLVHALAKLCRRGCMGMLDIDMVSK